MVGERFSVRITTRSISRHDVSDRAISSTQICKLIATVPVDDMETTGTVDLTLMDAPVVSDTTRRRSDPAANSSMSGLIGVQQTERKW